MSVTLDTSHFDNSPLNDVALAHIPDILVTLETSHLEMSPLNDFANPKMLFMSVMRDTSHSPIGPCEPLEQPPCGDSVRHEATACSSCALDRGENTDLRSGDLNAELQCCESEGRALFHTTLGDGKGDIVHLGTHHYKKSSIC